MPVIASKFLSPFTERDVSINYIYIYAESVDYPKIHNKKSNNFNIIKSTNSTGKHMQKITSKRTDASFCQHQQYKQS